MFGFDSLSTVFDNAVNCLLGSSLDEFFNNPNSNYVQEKTIRKNGHTITRRVRSTADPKTVVEDLFMDGKRVKPEEISWALEELESTPIKHKFDKWVQPLGCSNKLSDELVTGTKIPYMDMIHTKEGNLILKFAMAGIPEDNIEIYAEDDYLLVNLKSSEKEDALADYPEAVYLQRGIQYGYRNAGWKKVFIDPSKYDIKSTDYIYEDGLLTITVPKIKKPVERKVMIKRSK